MCIDLVAFQSQYMTIYDMMPWWCDDDAMMMRWWCDEAPHFRRPRHLLGQSLGFPLSVLRPRQAAKGLTHLLLSQSASLRDRSGCVKDSGHRWVKELLGMASSGWWWRLMMVNYGKLIYCRLMVRESLPMDDAMIHHRSWNSTFIIKVVIGSSVPGSVWANSGSFSERNHSLLSFLWGCELRACNMAACTGGNATRKQWKMRHHPAQRTSWAKHKRTRENTYKIWQKTCPQNFTKNLERNVPEKRGWMKQTACPNTETEPGKRSSTPTSFCLNLCPWLRIQDH